MGARDLSMFAIRGLKCWLLAALLLAAALQLIGQRGALNTENVDVIASAGQVSLSTKAVTVELKPSSSAAGAKSLAVRLERLSGNRHIFLVFRDVTTSEPPGVVFGVYIDLPNGTEPAQAEQHLAGYLNFFGLTGGAKSGFRSFDVTDLVRNLQKRSQLTETTTVTIRTDAAPAEGSKARIGSVELVEYSI